MTIATDLRAMREYIAKHGFSVQCQGESGGFCFVGAFFDLRLEGVGPNQPTLEYLQDFVGYWTPDELVAGGWRKPDALAVLDIAADCAEAEGK